MNKQEEDNSIFETLSTNNEQSSSGESELNNELSNSGESVINDEQDSFGESVIKNKQSFVDELLLDFNFQLKRKVELKDNSNFELKRKVELEDNSSFELKRKVELEDISRFDISEFCKIKNDTQRNQLLDIAKIFYDGNHLGFDIPLTIPIIPKFFVQHFSSSDDVKPALSLSEFIILSVILAFNLKGTFFNETNEYLSALLNLSISQVEKCIKSLLDRKMIFYIDIYGKKSSTKPIDKITINDLKAKFNNQQSLIKYLQSSDCENGININREFVVGLENMGSNLYKDFSSRYSNDEPTKEINRLLNKFNDQTEKIYPTVITQLRKKGIDIKDIIPFIKMENRENDNTWAIISIIFTVNDLDFDDFIQYLKKHKTFKKYFSK